MNQPRISLTCVVLNEAKYIESTIRSIQEQSYPDWELIIMDGASKDGTQDIIRRLAVEDPRIILTSEPDEGPWDATEKAVAQARGEFMMIVAGQDGFLDKDWFARCVKIFDEDPTVSLVWASTRGMHDDGTLFPEDHVSYSHLSKGDGMFRIVWGLVQKIWHILRGLIFSGSVRRRILFKKLFSRMAFFKLRFYVKRKFPRGIPPQKEDWFRYWLDTGTPFSEQPMCVVKKVYLDCVKPYPKGSRLVVNHIMDFHYTFNAKGYLSRYVPVLAGYGRNHPGNSGSRIPDTLVAAEKDYFRRVADLRKKYIENHEEMLFIDRNKREVLRQKF